MSYRAMVEVPPWLGTALLVIFFVGLPLWAAVSPTAEERRTGKTRGRRHG